MVRASRVALASVMARVMASVMAGVMALGAGACGGSARARFDGRLFQRADERFRVAPPPPRWTPLRLPRDADVGWLEPHTAAVIGANATCHGHGDPPLPVLVNDLLIGTTERQMLLEQETVLDGRGARHAVVAVRVDGVPLVYDLYVYKKDGCVYDLSLVAPPQAYDVVADDFVAFVAGFRGLGNGGR